MVSQRSYELSDVFGIHMPPVTEVDRFSNSLVTDLASKIVRPGWLMRLHGPSKSGKTVLVRQIMKRRGIEPILVHGSRIKTIEHFWIHIAASAPDRFAGIKDTITKMDELAIVSFCKAVKRPILVDDFHGVPLIVRKDILGAMKELTGDGISVIVVSVADVVLDLMKKDRALIRDFEGRTESFSAPLWKKEEIQEIGQKGFAALGQVLPKYVVDTLAHHSFRNPLLMQAYCEELCRKIRLSKTQANRILIQQPAQILQDVFKAVAARDKALHEMLWSTGGSHYKLNSGKDINIRGLILLSISHMPLVMPLKISNAKKEIRNLLRNKKDTPSLENIRTAAADLVAISEKLGRSDSGVLLFDNYLYVTHPFFKIYLIWVLYPFYTGEYPDLETYVERQPVDADAGDGAADNDSELD